MQSTTIELDNELGSDLKMVAKCYSMEQSMQNTCGITLLLTHCIGAHKEQWEPALQRIFEIQQLKDKKCRIREAWSFDWQNHGDSAVINRKKLQNRPCGISANEWASAIATFARSARMKNHRMVAIGHSGGAGVIVLSTKELSSYKTPYETMILVEPAIMHKELFYSNLKDRMAIMDLTVRVTSARYDTWDSRDSAYEYFKKSRPWSRWDDRVIRTLVEHGLELKSDSKLTLKCDRMQEAVSYTDKEGHFEAATILAQISHRVPVHIIWGTRKDFKLAPEESLSDTHQGRVIASVRKVQGAGHMVVQEQPDRLAQAICDILNLTPASSDLPLALARL